MASLTHQACQIHNTTSPLDESALLVSRLDSQEGDSFELRRAQKALAHSIVLLLWKLCVSWGNIRADDDGDDSVFVCEPFHFPGTLGLLNDCSRETAIKRLKVYAVWCGL